MSYGALDLRAIAKGPEGGGEGEGLAAGAEAAEGASEGIVEGLTGLQGHGEREGGKGGKGHGHAAKPEGHGEHATPAAHGSEAHASPTGQAAHEGGGGHAGGERHEAAPKPKGGGGGGGRQRDDHGRFAGKRGRAYRVAIRRSYEGAWGGPLPMFDRLADEQGDFATAHANQNKAIAPIGVASPGDFADDVNYENPGQVGANDPELVADGDEALWDLGETTSDDPDDGVDGGDDAVGPLPPSAQGTMPPGDFDDGAYAASAFDLPQQQTITARFAAAAKAAEAGDGLDDHPWGNPRMFVDAATFEDPADSWYTARAKAADLPDAAICLVWNDAGEILTVSRPEPPHEQSIPGGLVDPGETPVRAACRELREECAVDPLEPAQVAIVRSPTDGRRVYVFVARGGYSGTARAAEPNTRVEWLAPQQLLAQARLYRSTVRELMSAGLLSPRAAKASFVVPGVTGRPIDDGIGPVAAVKRVWDRVLAGQHMGPSEQGNNAPGIARVSWDRGQPAHGPALAKADEPGPQVLFQGIPVIIDRPKGYTQRGTDDQGCAWTRTYLYDYGYIPGTQGGDGEGLDVYLGPDAGSPWAFWAVQTDRAGCFDEYKVFLGFSSIEAAADAYAAHTPIELLGAIFTTDTGALLALLGRDPR